VVAKNEACKATKKTIQPKNATNEVLGVSKTVIIAARLTPAIAISILMTLDSFIIMV